MTNRKSRGKAVCERFISLNLSKGPSFEKQHICTVLAREMECQPIVEMVVPVPKLEEENSVAPRHHLLWARE